MSGAIWTKRRPQLREEADLPSRSATETSAPRPPPPNPALALLPAAQVKRGSRPAARSASPHIADNGSPAPDPLVVNPAWQSSRHAHGTPGRCSSGQPAPDTQRRAFSTRAVGSQHADLPASRPPFRVVSACASRKLLTCLAQSDRTGIIPRTPSVRLKFSPAHV